MPECLLSIDKFIFLLINDHLSSPFLDLFFRTITEARFWIIPGVAAACIFIKIERKKALIIIGSALLTVAITDPLSSQVLKPLFGRPRPCHPDFFVHGGRFIMGMKTSLSFPSSHAMNMFAQAALLSCFYPAKAAYFYGFALMIGYSRIYVGVHYPSDIAGGAFFGIITAYLVFITYSFIIRRKAKAGEAKTSKAVP